MAKVEVMTATQYVKRREFLQSTFIVPFLIAVFSLMGGICYQISPSHGLSHAAIVGVVYALIGVVGGLLLQKHLIDSLDERHSEMRFIPTWLDFGYSLDQYPVTVEQAQALEAPCLIRLQGFARDVNYMMECREALPRSVETMHPQNQATIEWSFTVLNDEVQRRNRRYLDYFDLVSRGLNAKDGLKLVSVPLQTAQQFRESLLPKPIA